MHLNPHVQEPVRRILSDLSNVFLLKPQDYLSFVYLMHRCTLVLKGRGTVTAAPDGRTWLNGTGNPGMAKGGSGDVLAGMIAALLGQKHLQGPHATVSETTALAVWLHGKAGDKCAQRFGEYAMLPSDLIGMLPEVLKENEERK